jgi:hypothetical protein
MAWARSTTDAVPFPFHRRTSTGQGDGACEEGQVHDQGQDHPAVAEGQLVLAWCGAVVDPSRVVDLLAPAAVRGVIDGQVQRRALGKQPGDEQPGQGQADLIGVPARTGEEVVGPVARPHPFQTRASEHPGDGPGPGLRDQSAGQGGEGAVGRHGETGPEHSQQREQRRRYGHQRTLSATTPTGV